LQFCYKFIFSNNQIYLAEILWYVLLNLRYFNLQHFHSLNSNW